MQELEPGTIDIILGGHDHLWYKEKVKETCYFKSGTNFRNLSLIKVDLNKNLDKDWID